MSANVAPAPFEVKAYHPAFLVYFLLSIAVVGSFFAYAMAIPLCLLGRLWLPAWHWGGEALRMGVDVLLKVQPWLESDVDIRLPPRRSSRLPYCMTVSNHRSHLDMFILLARIPNIRVIAKLTLFRVPLLGIMMRVMKNIPIAGGDIGSYWEAMQEARTALSNGDLVHVFPEMTRCTPGLRGTSEFHLAPFRVVKEAGVPLVPIAFVGTDEVWPRGIFGVSFRKPVVVRSLEPLDPAAFPSAEALRDETRRRIENFLSIHDS